MEMVGDGQLEDFGKLFEKMRFKIDSEGRVL